MARMRQFVRTAAAVVMIGAAGLVPVSDATAAGTTYTSAVIGDTPYTDAQFASFPAHVSRINADPAVRWVDHLGDIKSGSTPCTDAYYASTRSRFDAFADPLVYTPGDNEWADCSSSTLAPGGGPADPIERLAAVRRTFFPTPGTTLGVTRTTVTS